MDEDKKLTVIKKRQEDNDALIRNWKLKKVDGKQFRRQYETEIRRVNERRHLKLVKEEKNEDGINHGN